MSTVSRSAWFSGVAYLLQSAREGAAFMWPMMMVGASMAIWRYASAKAWRRGSVASPQGTWVLMTFSRHPSPTTS